MRATIILPRPIYQRALSLLRMERERSTAPANHHNTPRRIG